MRIPIDGDGGRSYPARVQRLFLALITLTAACSAEPPPQTPPAPSAAPSIPPPPAQTTAPSAQPAPDPIAACKRILREGIAHHDAGRYDDAIQRYEQGYRECGHGHGFQQEMGLSLAAKGMFDEAANRYMKEMSEPAPVRTTWGNCREILGKLSPAKRAELAALGSVPERPIHVPDIGYEYGWIELFACPSGEGKPAGQALIEHAGRKLDVLSFACPGGPGGKRYFDFSGDPRTKAMKKQLGP